LARAQPFLQSHPRNDEAHGSFRIADDLVRTKGDPMKKANNAPVAAKTTVSTKKKPAMPRVNFALMYSGKRGM